MKQGKEQSIKVLKKGTLVKHGTTSRSLQGIIDQGIRPRAHEYQFRSVAEHSPATEQAVYIGKHMAYCAAMLSFMDLVNSEALTPSPQQKNSIPIVLNIRLGDDCLVVADEDFVLLDKFNQDGWLPEKHKEEFFFAIREEGVKTWEEYGTAGLVRPDGIPAAWIESFEHPKLKLEKSLEIISDIELMLLGYRQQQSGLSLKEITSHIHYLEIKKVAFSQRHHFNSEGVKRYRSQEIMTNKDSRQIYCQELRGALLQLGIHKHGLPFHG